MTRAEAVALITWELETLYDERVRKLAEIVHEMAAGAGGLTRELSPAELELLEQSKEDFKAGRTYSWEEYTREMNGFMDHMRAKYPQST
ncbi:MAG: hypothetical protein WC807_03820 [Hyphomicrobium sp.]|jgi:hypothetical protein